MPLIRFVVERLQGFTEEIVVVSSSDLELPALPARVVVDREPALGPLGGIREGLHAIEAELAFVCCTDSPLVDAAFAEALLQSETTAACEVEGFVEPFPAVYERSLAATADALLAEGRMRALHLLEVAGFHRVDGSSWAKRGVFSGFNTPVEYLSAVAGVDSGENVLIELFGASRQALGRARIEAAAGTLREVLGSLAPGLTLCYGDSLSPRVRISLNEGQSVDDLGIPIGPGERLQIHDEDGDR